MRDDITNVAGETYPHVPHSRSSFSSWIGCQGPEMVPLGQLDQGEDHYT